MHIEDLLSVSDVFVAFAARLFMLLLPAFSQLEQHNALAVLARKLRNLGALERLRSAANRVELYRAITA